MEHFEDNSVRVSIAYSKLKTCELLLRFPEGYPSTKLACEVRTRTLPEKLVATLRKRLDGELDALSSEGKP